MPPIAAALLLAIAGTADPAPPRLRWSLWPGAVTTSPRPRPDSIGVPLRTTIWFELETGTDAKGDADPIDPASVNAWLVAGRDEHELVRGGAIAAGAAGRIFPAGNAANPFAPDEPLAVHVALDAPLPPATRCEVRVEASGRSGLALLSRGGRFGFTTRRSDAATDAAPIVLRGDASRTVHFEQRIFSGLLKPTFDTSELFGQIPTYDLMSAVAGPPPLPAVGSLQRDWPLCGDYWTNAWFDGDPNLVREIETRLVTAIVQESIEPDGKETAPARKQVGRKPAPEPLIVSVADLPERKLYGIAAGRPLAPDFPVGCSVLLVDAQCSREAAVLGVDEAARTVRVIVRPSAADRGDADAPRDAPDDPPIRRAAGDWRVPAAPDFPPDSAATPANFPRPGCYLKKLRPCGTPVLWFGRLDHEWDLVHRRHDRRLVVNFDRVPCDLSLSGVPGRCSTFKDAVEWFDFVRTVTSHVIERYGRAALDFHWSIFNEPDLRPLFWDDGDLQLFATYDLATDAILRAFEEHDLPSERVKVGGLELGALAAEPQLLASFLAHCSPRAPETDSFGGNFALREPRLAGRHSRRVETIAAGQSGRDGRAGRGSPCDFVSLHQYKHAAFAIEQLRWARRRALEIDPDHFAGLAVVAFETDPDWNPTRDPATRAMFLGNGFWPAWAADWSGRAIAAAFDDPAFTRHEALLTVWPQEQNLAGIPTLTSILVQRNADGTTTQVTIPKDILHFLAFLGGMGTDYFVLGESGAAVPGTAAAGDPAAIVAGFGAIAGDELALLVYAHDPLDPEVRDTRARNVRIELAHVPFAAGELTIFALDADHASPWPIARRVLDSGPPASFLPDDVAALQRVSRLEPIETPRAVAMTNGGLTIETSLPANGLRCFRVQPTR